jgi:hypothetical protein
VVASAAASVAAAASAVASAATSVVASSCFEQAVRASAKAKAIRVLFKDMVIPRFNIEF